jgi:magnesium chelatase subunit D
MGAQQRMVATKGAVISLLLDAYQRRDKVAMIAFKGTEAEVVLSPTSSAKLAQERLAQLPTGGRTPMARALLEARKLIHQHKLRDQDMPPLLVVVSDCRANVGISSIDPFEETLKVCESLKEDKVQSIVLDPAPRSGRFGLVQKVSASLGGQYIPLEELRADAIRAAVRRTLDAEGS